jgi:ankyrin repeat protein
MQRRLVPAGIALLTILFAAPLRAQPAPRPLSLFEAVQLQDVEALKALLAKGADANTIENGRPLLGWAAQNGNTQIVDLLLKAGANPNLADQGIGHTPLMRAIETQQPGAILLLLKAKADPNAKTPDGESCLTMAVESRKPKVVQALIVSGANVKEVMPSGDSPALTAAQDGMPESFEIIKILGKAGAEMNASNAAYTPLVYAIEQGNVELVKTLLESGANPNAKTQSGRTPLSAALGNKEIFQALLDAKADPNAKNGSGETPLAEAIYNDQIDLVKMLLAAGADTKQAGPDGKTALEYAQLHYRTDIIALLSQATNTEPGTATAQAAAPKSVIKCSMVDAARMQMILHGSLEDQVALGNMSSEIFRTFGEDTKDYAQMLADDPSQACGLFEDLAKKYGVESPYAKLNAAPK